MSTILTLAALAIAGGFAGRWLRGQDPALRRLVVLGALALPLAAVALIGISRVLGIDALGWIGGLSLMVGLPLAAPLLVGALVGWLLGKGGAPPSAGAADNSSSATPPTGAQPASPTVPAVRRPALQPQQLNVLVVMAGVAAAFWVAIGVGFQLHGEVAPAPLRAGLLPAVAVLAFVLAMAGRAIKQRGGVRFQPWIARPTSNEGDERAERWRRELAEMAADPRRRAYAERIKAGETFWTPDRVEYDLDPTATTCCVHLAPLERAMRAAGVRVRLMGVGQADALALTNEAAVRAAHSLGASVVYEEISAYDRSAEDPPVARWRCTSCETMVWVVHPRVGEVGAVSFPAKGA